MRWTKNYLTRRSWWITTWSRQKRKIVISSNLIDKSKSTRKKYVSLHKVQRAWFLPWLSARKVLTKKNNWCRSPWWILTCIKTNTLMPWRLFKIQTRSFLKIRSSSAKWEIKLEYTCWTFMKHYHNRSQENSTHKLWLS